jgi:hypothetical protein
MQSEAFSLLDEEWIPVLWTNGEPGRVGIVRALTEARRIRQIAASNPLDNVALLRFLLAVLHWCKPNPTPDELAQLEGDGGIPEDWQGKLVKHRDAFNLLGEGKRFYQDATFRSECSRTVGDLRTDLPTGTTIAHFRHLRDLAYGLCPACCAGGLIRFCAFATAYGGGSYTSAVNGQSPAFALAEGRTLLRTIVLNALESAPSGRPPPWLIDEGPGEEDDLEAVTVLAWRSRRVWLGEAADWGSSCACCGDQGPTVREMAFTGGWKLPFAKSTQKKFWKDDPHLVLAPTAHSKGDPAAQADGLPPGSEAAKEVTTLGFPAPALGVAVRALLAAGPDPARARRSPRRPLLGGARTPGRSGREQSPLPGCDGHLASASASRHGSARQGSAPAAGRDGDQDAAPAPREHPQPRPAAPQPHGRAGRAVGVDGVGIARAVRGVAG